MKNVLQRLNEWRKINGSSEPRLMLDDYFYSYIFGNDTWGYKDYSERDDWCDDVFGPENWFRMFNKFWFTTHEQYIQFKLTWHESDKRTGISS